MYIFGRFVGLLMFWLIVKPMRFLYDGKKTKLLDTHHLEELKGKSFIIVGNHIKPRSKFLKGITLPYDSFIARGVLKKFGVYATALTSYDAGPTSSKAKKKKKTFRKDLLVKGIVESIDLIPLNRSESDPDTIRQFKKRLDAGNIAIGIYPEGTWFRGYRKARKFQNGLAILAKRYGLPVIPIYVHAYNLKKKTFLCFGKPVFNVDDSGAVGKFIKEEMNRMYELVKIEAAASTS